MARCATCKSRVEDGAVRCMTCGANLARPGAFIHTLGWVILALSAIPLAMSEVTTREGTKLPLIMGGSVALVGIVMLICAKVINSTTPPEVIADDAVEPPPTFEG